MVCGGKCELVLSHTVSAENKIVKLSNACSRGSSVPAFMDRSVCQTRLDLAPLGRRRFALSQVLDLHPVATDQFFVRFKLGTIVSTSYTREWLAGWLFHCRLSGPTDANFPNRSSQKGLGSANMTSPVATSWGILWLTS